MARASHRASHLQLTLRWALSRRATHLWWGGFGVLIATAVTLRTAAWLGLPTIATADTDAYCRVVHAMEEGRLPDLRERNAGYPLFLLACKMLPLPLNRGLPLAQHLLELASTIIVMLWMLRNWGTLASLMTGALLLVNSSHVVWSHYGQPNALLCSVVPIAAVVTMSGLVNRTRGWVLLAAALWLVVLLTRDEVLILGVTALVVVAVAARPWRRQCVAWLVVIAGVVAVAYAARTGVNALATGHAVYSLHTWEAFCWRVLHEDALVAPPRPALLTRFYEAAARSGIAADWQRGEHLHWEGLKRVGAREFRMSPPEVTRRLAGCAWTCVRQRPGIYAAVVARDILRLWTRPSGDLEWEAFRQSDPVAFRRDASRLEWAQDARVEFPSSYEGSIAQRLFHRLAVLRPGQTFAGTPLIASFLLGLVCLATGVGAKPQRFRRWWFLGLACGVLGLTFVYAAWGDAVGRYRMSMEWAFFAVASLGIVLPLRAVQMRLMRRQPASFSADAVAPAFHGGPACHPVSDRLESPSHTRGDRV